MLCYTRHSTILSYRTWTFLGTRCIIIWNWVSLGFIYTAVEWMLELLVIYILLVFRYGGVWLANDIEDVRDSDPGVCAVAYSTVLRGERGSAEDPGGGFVSLVALPGHTGQTSPLLGLQGRGHPAQVSRHSGWRRQRSRDVQPPANRGRHSTEECRACDRLRSPTR